MKHRAWHEIMSFWELDAPNCETEVELPDGVAEEYKALLARHDELYAIISAAVDSAKTP